MPLRLRCEYAAVFPRSLPGSSCPPPREFPARTSGQVRAAPSPYPPDLSWCRIKGVSHAGSSRTPLRLARRTRPIWQYQDAPALSGPLPPSPAPSGSGCPQLQRPAATGHRRRSLTSTRTTAPHGARRKARKPLGRRCGSWSIASSTRGFATPQGDTPSVISEPAERLQGQDEKGSVNLFILPTTAHVL